MEENDLTRPEMNLHRTLMTKSILCRAFISFLNDVHESDSVLQCDCAWYVAFLMLHGICELSRRFPRFWLSALVATEESLNRKQKGKFWFQEMNTACVSYGVGTEVVVQNSKN